AESSSTASSMSPPYSSSRTARKPNSSSSSSIWSKSRRWLIVTIRPRFLNALATICVAGTSLSSASSATVRNSLPRPVRASPAATLQLGHAAGDVLLHRRLVDATRLLLLLVLRLAPAIRREALGLDADLATRSRARRRGRRGRPLRRGRRTAQHVRGATQTRTLLGRRDARRALLGRLRLRPCHRLGRTLGLGRRRRPCLALLSDGRFRRRGSLCLDARSGLGCYDLTPRLGGIRGLGRDRLGSVRCRRSTLRVDDDLLGLTILEERRLPGGRRCTL